jgi:hypothetical protein
MWLCFYVLVVHCILVRSFIIVSLCGYLLLLFSVILYIDQFTDNCCRLSVRNTPRSVGVILCSDRPWYIIEVVEVVYGYSSSRICGGSCGGSDHCA